jgi:hypothetical protein
MLSSLKKPSDKSVVSLVPPWRPNFRNFERLPDTKAVRTTFFVNGLALLVAVSLTIYLVYKEIERSTLAADAETARSIAAERKPLSDRAIAQAKKFQNEENKVKELHFFLTNSKIKVSELLLELGSSLPPSVLLNSVEYRVSGVTARGAISGSAEEGARKAVAYVEKLRQEIYFDKHFETITLTGITRDPAAGEMRFEIDFKLYTLKSSKGGKL